jgi:hypothetical protein
VGYASTVAPRPGAKTADPLETVAASRDDSSTNHDEWQGCRVPNTSPQSSWLFVVPSAGWYSLCFARGRVGLKDRLRLGNPARGHQSA